MPASHDHADPHAKRRRWMGVLAKAERADLEAAWQALPDKPEYHWLRMPEIGLAMVRGRIGGNGGPFNLGEMTITRCVVQLTTGNSGYAYVAGRDKRHAELAAVFDALLQAPHWHDRLQNDVVEPLAHAYTRRRQKQSAKVAATRVDFFTLVRGDD
jgi:alpha-D-ribose 1-methylphosphonate 5-triphosphate synthase subunit PhnG